MKILITGSNGMLGTDLCLKLSKESYSFIGVDIKRPYRKKDTYDFRELDITKRDRVRKLIEDIRPSLLIHAAAYTAVDDCEVNRDLAYKVNSEATGNIAEACKKIDALMIYISTDYVFDGKKHLPYEVDDATNPLSIYGDSKLRGEIAIKDNLDKYFIIRTSWLYGKYGPNFVDKIISKVKEVSELRIVNDQIGSPTSTLDLARALFKLIQLIEKGIFRDKGNFGIYHITNSGSCNWYEYAKEIIKIAGIDVSIKPISSLELNSSAKRPSSSVLSNKRFERLTDFKMQIWKKALEEYLKLN